MIVAVGVAVVVVAAVIFTASADAWDAAGKLLSGNLMLQTLLGTYIASTAAGLSRSATYYGFLWARDVFMTSVTVPTSQPFLLDAVRRFMAAHASKVLWKQSQAVVPVAEALTWKERFQAMVQGLQTKRAANPVKLVPITATVTFPLKFKGTWTLFAASNEGIVVSVLGRGKDVFVQELLQHISDTEASNRPAAASTSNAVVHVASFDSSSKVWRWQRSYDLPPRNASSLVLDGDAVSMLLDDARMFFTSADEYHKQQQPFRRGWLLHGPPGTGKSTAAMVVATELDLPVYVLQAGNPELDDSALNTLMTTAQVPALILLEDIDAACSASKTRFAKPTTTATSTSDAGPASFISDWCKPPSKLTQAGLLNALDGVGAHQGHIVIMTTNAIEALDPAVIREGRCDLHVKMSFASADQVRRLFLVQFPDATPEQVRDFCDAVPEDKYSPAKISAYLRKRAYSVTKALGDCPEHFCSFNITTIFFGFRTCNTYDLLWSHGMECKFAETVCKDPFMFTSRLVSFAPVIQERVSACPNQPSRPATVRDAHGYFKAAFPNATVAQHKEFGRAIEAFNATHPVKMTHDRIIQYLYINADSVQLALRDMDKWLLTYGRAPGCNIVRQFTMFHLTRLNVEDEEAKDLLKFAKRGNRTSWASVRGTPGGTYLSSIASSTFSICKVSTRMEIATLFEDAFGCDFETSYRYARDLCDDEGRCWWLSMLNIRNILAKPQCTGPDEYAAALRAYADETASTRDEDVFAKLQQELEEEYEVQERRAAAALVKAEAERKSKAAALNAEAEAEVAKAAAAATAAVETVLQ